jgi:hypothetical protein
VGTLLQDTPQRHPDSQPREDRLERADLFEPYREWRTQGISERQAAPALKVPRTTLQAWRTWHDSLASCPPVAEFFQSGPGLACVHRLVVGFHLVCVAVGACGIRLACLVLKLTGLDRFVATSYGAQPQVNGQGEEAMVAYRHTETARLATDMPRQDITVTPDDTCTGGLCLVGSAPVSHFILLAQLAQRRDHAAWNALMAPALAQLNGQVMQSTRDEAPGLVASVAHPLEAHHSPMYAMCRMNSARPSGLRWRRTREPPTQPPPKRKSRAIRGTRPGKRRVTSQKSAVRAALQRRP